MRRASRVFRSCSSSSSRLDRRGTNQRLGAFEQTIPENLEILTHATKCTVFLEEEAYEMMKIASVLNKNAC